MTALAISLYLLGVIGGAAAVGRDVSPGVREWVVILIWPFVVAATTILGLVHYLWSRFHP